MINIVRNDNNNNNSNNNKNNENVYSVTARGCCQAVQTCGLIEWMKLIRKWSQLHPMPWREESAGVYMEVSGWRREHRCTQFRLHKVLKVPGSRRGQLSTMRHRGVFGSKHVMQLMPHKFGAMDQGLHQSGVFGPLRASATFPFQEKACTCTRLCRDKTRLAKHDATGQGTGRS